jgi:hypothetical protein
MDWTMMMPHLRILLLPRRLPPMRLLPMRLLSPMRLPLLTRLPLLRRLLQMFGFAKYWPVVEVMEPWSQAGTSVLEEHPWGTNQLDSCIGIDSHHF